MTLPFLLDIDGVCADWRGHLLRTARSGKRPADVIHWDIFALLTVRQRLKAERALEGRTFWDTIPAVDGAVEGVDAILEAGHQIVVATSPWWSCPEWSGARYEWIKRHPGIHPRDVVIGHRKDLIRGSILLDDKPSTIDAWAKANPDGQAWLFDAPYNRDRPDLDRVDWAEIMNRI